MYRRVIPLQVSDEYVRGDGVPVGAAGSHDDVALRLTFGPMWAGTARSIVWYDANGENPTITALTTDMLAEGESEVYLVPIPAAPKAVAGQMLMTIKGATVSGSQETTATLTTTARFTVMESDWSEDAEEGGDITPTQAEQFQAEIENIKAGIVAAKAAGAAAAESEQKAAASEAAAAGSASAAAASQAAAAASASQAEAAQSKAESAQAAAQTAQKAAGSAQTAAENAQEAAEAAQGKAESAQSAAAESAQAAAASATSAAGSAQGAAGSEAAAQGYANEAAGSAANAEACKAAAAASQAEAAESADAAESWAVGGTGTRQGEDTDNARYWAKQAEAAAGGDFATKLEAQGYVSTHNQSSAPAADLRQAIAGKETAGAAAAVQSNLDDHMGNKSNPHGVTKAQVGLGNVNNTSDANKPVSTKQQTALDLKQDKLTGSAGQFVGFDAQGNAVAVDAPNSLYLDSIAITTPPTKTAYKAGETFNTAGMVVKAQYTNGTVIIAKDIVVTGWNVSPSGALEAGRTSVTVQYTENGVTKTASQAVTVTKTALTVPSQSGSLTYTGGSQSPAWSNYNSSLETLGGTTSGTNAGTYSATFTIKNTDLYCWSDGTTAAKSVGWTIDKAAGTLALSKASMTLQPGKTSDSFTITTNSSGAISVSNGNTAIATASRSGSTVTVSSVGAKSGTAVITVSAAGDSNHTAPASKTCTVTCAFVSIYGVQWDGTSTTLWSRTDDAAGFVNPSPAVNNGDGSSPFDGKLPWSGMVIEDDATAGKLVKIPKYWYKWTRSGSTMKLQIADAATEGFSVSPAHADRGDGKGERDYVYVGRYHCNSSYKSQAGSQPKYSMTRSSARSGIHNLGSSYWQYDFAMYWTIMMLYLVEYADWNSQKVIGYGCSPSGSRFNMGATDAMTYHTGTSASSRTAYGSVQYRHIEGLWDNVYDWCDGIYFSGSGVYCIKNPASFSDSSGGTNVGTRSTGSGYISGWTNPTASGFEYALYPNAVSGSESSYVCDCCYYSSSGVVLCVGGYYDQGQIRGAFYLGGNCTASNSSSYIGCRLQKLP